MTKNEVIQRLVMPEIRSLESLSRGLDFGAGELALFAGLLLADHRAGIEEKQIQRQPLAAGLVLSRIEMTIKVLEEVKTKIEQYKDE